MNLSALLGIVIALLIAGLLFWLITWIIDYAGVPEPFSKVAKIIVAIVAILYIFGVITGHFPRVTL